MEFSEGGQGRSLEPGAVRSQVASTTVRPLPGAWQLSSGFLELTCLDLEAPEQPWMSYPLLSFKSPSPFLSPVLDGEARGPGDP